MHTTTALPHKESIQFTLETIKAFLNAASSSKALSERTIIDLKKECEKLQENIKPDTVYDLKLFIQRINEQIPKPYAPLPPFSTEFPHNQLKNNVIAFEIFINHCLQSKLMTLAQEEPLFQESLHLWRDLNGRLSVQEGLSKFIHLIHVANSYLPENQRFPIPQTTLFQ